MRDTTARTNPSRWLVPNVNGKHMIAVLPLIYVIALCASLSHSFPGARQCFFFSFAGRSHEVANWNFYWFNSFNWIICSRRLFSAFRGNARPQRKNERNHIFCILIFLRLLIHWNRKQTNRVDFWAVFFSVGKIENAFESAHFFSSVRWGETSMSSCDSNVLGQTARSTLICFTVTLAIFFQFHFSI